MQTINKLLFIFSTLFFLTVNTFAQDVITLKNGNEINAKVQEVGIDDVTYKANGQIYTKKQSEIFRIVYANGTVEVFKNSSPIQEQQLPIEKKQTQKKDVQKKDTIYYDKNWKGCFKWNAEYYRVVNYNSDGNPVGKINDYYITGELRGEIDGAISIDNYDDKNSKFTGYSVGYNKNGTRWSNYRDNEGNYVSRASYYANGKIFRKQNYTSGKPDKFYIECDEFGKCENVFYERFGSENDGWAFGNESDFVSQIITIKQETENTPATKAVLMKVLTENNNIWRTTINIPLSLTENFSIETTVEFKDGYTTSQSQGIIWGFKNWDDYYTFNISANGYYKIGGKENGVFVTIKEWTETSLINKNKAKNKLKILRVGNKINFVINGSIVFTDTFRNFKGNNIGFCVSGKAESIFENLIVKQDMPAGFDITK